MSGIVNGVTVQTVAVRRGEAVAVGGVSGQANFDQVRGVTVSRMEPIDQHHERGHEDRPNQERVKQDA